jgi:hypothetical protein
MGRVPGSGLARCGPARFTRCVPAGAEQGAMGLGINPSDRWGWEREQRPTCGVRNGFAVKRGTGVSFAG